MAATKQATRTATCGHCGKRHQITQQDFNAFGPDAQCIPCVDRKHNIFMAKNAKRFGMTCVKGCRCGFGK